MFQLHVSIYVSITSTSNKELILFHNYKFISRVGFTKGFTSVLRRIIIGLASWQLSIYTSLNSHQIEQSEAQSQANKNKHTLHLASRQLSIYISLNFHQIEQSEAESQANKNKYTLHIQVVFNHSISKKSQVLLYTVTQAAGEQFSLVAFNVIIISSSRKSTLNANNNLHYTYSQKRLIDNIS